MSDFSRDELQEKNGEKSGCPAMQREHEVQVVGGEREGERIINLLRFYSILFFIKFNYTNKSTKKKANDPIRYC